MEELSTLQNRYNLKELELNSLLEITQAINNNLPEESLYKIYNFTLRGNFNVKKVALFVLEDQWEIKVHFGTKNDFAGTDIPEELLKIKNISRLNGIAEPFDEFDTVIPIMHKGKIISYLFVKGAALDAEEMPNVTTTNYLQALTNIIIVAIENRRLTQRQLRQEALRKELEIARDVQKFLFPEELPYGVRLKIEASYLPHHTVGGDYYDYIPLNQNQFLICIADVSGKGVPAAIIMSNFQASLRTLIRHTPNLSEIVETLNYQLLEHAKGENFITFFAGIYDHKLKSLVYVNAGHNHPLLITDSGKLEYLDEGCTVLGAFHPLPFINEGFITDLDDFLLFLYTDGLSEAVNQEGEEFGLSQIENFIKSNYKKEPKEIHKLLLADLEKFKGKEEYRDDITLVSCRMQGG